jgi:hypothetical protein
MFSKQVGNYSSWMLYSSKAALPSMISGSAATAMLFGKWRLGPAEPIVLIRLSRFRRLPDYNVIMDQN